MPRGEQIAKPAERDTRLAGSFFCRQTDKGAVVIRAALAHGGVDMSKIKVKCSEGHEFYMEDYERKACPECGRLVIGPKAK